MEAVYRDILALRDRCALLVAVTISGLREADYRGETAAYVRDLNRLNALLLEAADEAAALADGKPIACKSAWTVTEYIGTNYTRAQ